MFTIKLPVHDKSKFSTTLNDPEVYYGLSMDVKFVLSVRTVIKTKL